MPWNKNDYITAALIISIIIVSVLIAAWQLGYLMNPNGAIPFKTEKLIFQNLTHTNTLNLKA